MFKIILIVSALALIIGVISYLLLFKGVDLRQYEHLKSPRITTLPDTPVLAVEFETSTEGLKEVFGFLFSTYFKIKGVPKRSGKIMPALARYENALDFDMEEAQRNKAFANITWKGIAAIPLPHGIKDLPVQTQDRHKLSARLSSWQYGETAEILHIGPYEKEGPTVQKIREFIDTQGYEICGFHEEVYLRGPGLPWNRPENYYTIIRYPVRKKQ